MKRRARKFLAIVIAVAMLVGMMPVIAFAGNTYDFTLWLEDGKIRTIGNVADEATLSNLGITASGDASSGYTYTFDGVNFVTSADVGIVFGDDKATLQLSPDSLNTITTKENYGNVIGISATALTIKGKGSLNINTGDGKGTASWSEGIVVLDSLTINGSEVTISAGDANTLSAGIAAPSGAKSMTFKNCEIYAKGADYGCYGSKNVSIEGATVTLSGAQAACGTMENNKVVAVAPKTKDLAVKSAKNVYGSGATLLNSWKGDGTDNVSGVQYLHFSKAQSISNVAVTVAVPKAGQKIGDVKVSADPGNVSVTDVKWMGIANNQSYQLSDEMFEEGKVYRIFFKLTPASGQVFASDLRVTLNGFTSVPDQSGWYYRDITAAAGNSLSGTATISGDLSVGGSATCNANVTPSGLTLKYQWQKYGNLAWSDIPGATSKNLSLANYAAGTQLHCVVTSTTYAGSIESNNITVAAAETPATPTPTTPTTPSLPSDNQTIIILTIDSPVISINGKQSLIDTTGTKPVILNSRTLLPVRAVVEAMGGTVGWDNNTRVVSMQIGQDTLKMQIGNNVMWDNHGNTIQIDTAPTIINSRTMLPIRFVAEYFGATVSWNGINQKVTVVY